ncbi:MAG: Zn-finger nucleic acid-binding protein [Halieaceae bacterium]|jgi:Zn-finger nucleic acid-binding protein
MICPKCNCEMKEIEAKLFSALKCTGCAGIWFRDGSHELARSIADAGDIDSNPDQENAGYNDIRDIDCPECHKKTIKMIDRAQLHIEFEACTYCRGVFFDCGEFKDLTEFTFAERIKQAISTLKSNLNT